MAIVVVSIGLDPLNSVMAWDTSSLSSATRDVQDGPAGSPCSGW